MAGVYKLLVGCHNGIGNYFSNIFSYQLSEAGAGHPFDYANALIDSWVTGCETEFLALLGSDVVLDFIQCKKVNGSGGPSATQSRGSNGSGFTPSISSQLAADISWITASALNRFGRNFIGAIWEGALEQDFFQAGFLVAVTAFINAMKTVLNLAGALGTATFGVFTRKTNTFNDTLSGVIKPKATVMNKRALPRV